MMMIMTIGSSTNMNHLLNAKSHRTENRFKIRTTPWVSHQPRPYAKFRPCQHTVIDISKNIARLRLGHPAPLQEEDQASTETPLGLEASALRFLTAPGRLRVYFAKARARAFLHETFWLPTKLSTATAMARSMSAALQYSERRILAKDSEIRRMDSRWRTWKGGSQYMFYYFWFRGLREGCGLL